MNLAEWDQVGDLTVIEELDLSVRSYNCLKREGIDTVGQLKVLTDEDIRQIRNLNDRSIEEIRTKLDEYEEGRWPA